MPDVDVAEDEAQKQDRMSCLLLMTSMSICLLKRLLTGAWCLLQKHNTVYETLKRVADSEPRELDAWQISLSAGISRLHTVLAGFLLHH